MKTALKILLWSLPLVAILVVFLLATSDDPSATIIEITNVSSKQVAEALREESMVDQSGLFWSGAVHVWPSADQVNRPRAVFKYKVEHFITATEGVDVVGITLKEPDTVVVSLRCLQKREFLSGLVRVTHTRKIERERDILSGAVKRLRDSAAKAGKTVTAKGLSGWQPRLPEPSTRPASTSRRSE